ncbi:MAG: hypothetical protein ACPGWR_26285 [Ardenticatenaceae bacterium]
MNNKRVFYFLFVVALLISGTLMSVSAEPSAQSAEGEDYDVPNGHFFTQTAEEGGFSVLDDGEARFWSEFERLGGVQTVGYPISRRYMADGFVTQAFQKLILQWRPEVEQAWPVNVFDELSKAGFDDQLFSERQTPKRIESSTIDPPDASWEEVVDRRQGFLDANAAIRARYFFFDDPLTVFGLPTSRVEDMGNHFAIRMQRAVFQQWTEEVPWAERGQVTIANGGDIAKELAWLPSDALLPESAPSPSSTSTPTAPQSTPSPSSTSTPAATPSPSSTPAAAEWEVYRLLVGPGEPGRLYALQSSFTDSSFQYRLMISDDLGNSWAAFPGGLPPSEDVRDLTMDYLKQDALYVTTEDGLYKWDSNQWALLSERDIHHVAVAYRQSDTIWGTDGPDVLRSDDGGKTWRTVIDAETTSEATPGTLTDFGFDPRDNKVLYGIFWNHGFYYLARGNADGEWERMPSPRFLNQGMAIDGETGNLYTTTWTRSPDPNALWRSPNPRQANLDDVRWEEIHEFSPHVVVRLLAAGGTPDGEGLGFYATLDSQLHYSPDAGQSWQKLTIP